MTGDRPGRGGPGGPGPGRPDRSEPGGPGPDDRDDLEALGLIPLERLDPDAFDTGTLLGRLDDALPSPPTALLVVIALLSLAHLVTAAPWAVGADPFGLLAQSSASHQVRDGAVGVIVAVAGLLTVWRPRWAVPCFALSAVALVGQLIAGFIDNSIIQSGPAELIHATSVVLATLIGLSAVRLTALGPSRPPGRPAPRPNLQVVADRHQADQNQKAVSPRRGRSRMF